MLSERGIVTHISDNILSVTCRSKIDCIRCAEGKGCGGGILARWLGDRQFSIHTHFDPILQNPQVGDFVLIALPAKRVVKLAAIMYALPLLTMLVFLLFQVAFFPGVHELFSILLAMIGLFFGFGLSRYLVARANRRGLMLPGLISPNSDIEIPLSTCKNQMKRS